MITSALADILEREYEGRSFNGPPVKTTLMRLSLEQAMSTETIDGYSVFGVTLHLAYYKYLIARGLDAADLRPFPYEDADFPSVPADRSADAWRRALQALDEYHRASVAAIRSMPDERLQDEFPRWGCTAAEAIEWYVTHDVYHAAQIRSMGVPGLATT